MHVCTATVSAEETFCKRDDHEGPRGCTAILSVDKEAAQPYLLARTRGFISLRTLAYEVAH
jgi:hypothetical protein